MFNTGGRIIPTEPILIDSFITRELVVLVPGVSGRNNTRNDGHGNGFEFRK